MRLFVVVLIVSSLVMPSAAHAFGDDNVDAALNICSAYPGTATTVESLAVQLESDVSTVLGVLAALRSWSFANGRNDLDDAELSRLVQGVFQNSAVGVPLSSFSSVFDSATTNSDGTYLDVLALLDGLGFSSPSSGIGVADTYPNENYAGFESGLVHRIAPFEILATGTAYPYIHNAIYSYDDEGVTLVPSAQAAVFNAFWTSPNAPLKTAVGNAPSVLSNQRMSLYTSITARDIKCVICGQKWALGGSAAVHYYTTDTSVSGLYPHVYGTTAINTRFTTALNHVVNNHPSVINMGVVGQDLVAFCESPPSRFVLVLPAAIASPNLVTLSQAVKIPESLPQGLDGVNDDNDPNVDYLSGDFLNQFRSLSNKISGVFPFSMVTLIRHAAEDFNSDFGGG